MKVMRTLHMMSFRVNDTTITHIDIYTDEGEEKEIAIRIARKRLERKGYVITEIVTYKSKDGEI